jgi:hypothetical protein
MRDASWLDFWSSAGLRAGAFAVALTSGACSDSDPGGSGPASSRFESLRQACVDRINAFRATENKPPYERWADGEGCTERQSGLDAESGEAHANFGECGENAQNTCPGWPDADAVVEDCLQRMWDEGPGEPFSEHGHYLNMSSTRFTEVACGFFEMSNGDIWANQNFR